MSANGIAPDGTPHFAASHLCLFCLPKSHKKDARLIWVKLQLIRAVVVLAVTGRISNIRHGRG